MPWMPVNRVPSGPISRQHRQSPSVVVSALATDQSSSGPGSTGTSRGAPASTAPPSAAGRSAPTRPPGAGRPPPGSVPPAEGGTVPPTWASPVGAASGSPSSPVSSPPSSPVVSLSFSCGKRPASPWPQDLQSGPLARPLRGWMCPAGVRPQGAASLRRRPPRRGRTTAARGGVGSAPRRRRGAPPDHSSSLASSHPGMNASTAPDGGVGGRGRLAPACCHAALARTSIPSR
jgi:hypothetical protein